MPEKSSDLDREYRECVRRLYSIAPSFQVVGASGYHPGLDNMRAFAAFLGNPHLSLRAVHVAGTNGKGSVAHMLASALACARPGTSIGLYTSPHLVDFRERIKTVSIDGSGDGRCFSEIGKEDVVDFLRRAADFINERRPSFFEITTAMAFDYFHRRGVDMAVIETGLGGRLDSTNIIVPELSVITSIGLDHKNILGDTIEKIAAFFKVNPAYLMGWTVSDEKTEDIICNSVKDDAETQEPEESAAIAAYFDGEGYTDKELKQIERFAHYIKSLRDKNTE